MKRYMLPLLAAVALPVFAAKSHESLNITSFDVLKSENAITVNMIIDPAKFNVKSDNILSLTPAVISGSDTLRLDPITVAGKKAWYTEVRNSRRDDRLLLRSGKGKALSYSTSVPFENWMESSKVEVLTALSSQCNCNPPLCEDIAVAELDFRPRRFNPVFSYSAPVDTAEKRFDLSGRADVRFIVNKTAIDWNYADNRSELDAILSSINAVKENPDATVGTVLLTGYASPEGSYANNVRLAKGRTETVKEYVRKNSGFPSSIFRTASVAEDWNGLREWILSSSMPRKNEMIAFIDDNSIPIEKKNDIFSTRFPEEYRILLRDVYPSLRHTDYRITFTVRKYLDVDEIRKVMRTNPRNLSQNELFLLANSCKPGSAEYDEAFALAATLFPDNATANLNAANSAMNRGDYGAARKYLDRAGNSPQAVYAKGVLLALEGDFAKALPLFREADKNGVKEASEAIDQIQHLSSFSGNVKIL